MILSTDIYFKRIVSMCFSIKMHTKHKFLFKCSFSIIVPLEFNQSIKSITVGMNLLLCISWGGASSSVNKKKFFLSLERNNHFFSSSCTIFFVYLKSFMVWSICGLANSKRPFLFYGVNIGLRELLCLLISLLATIIWDQMRPSLISIDSK